MLMVKCAYCRGTGKTSCACRSSIAKSRNELASMAINSCDIKGTWDIDKNDRIEKSDISRCPLCRGTGELICSGCWGSGFVEMPAWA